MWKKFKRGEKQTWSVLRQDKFICQISISYLKRQRRKVMKTKFKKKAITQVKVGQAWQHSNLICAKPWSIYIPNFKSKSWNDITENTRKLKFSKAQWLILKFVKPNETQTWFILTPSISGTPDICGVMITLGRSHSGDSGGSGSFSMVSRQAPLIHFCLW